MNDFVINGSIDWKLLREQKMVLLVLEKDGIVGLIDNIQDSALKSGQWTEEEIFGPAEEYVSEEDK